MTDNLNSKAQYENRFKTWDFRKNMNDSEWKFVIRRVNKRKLDGKESVAYFNDNPIPEKRLKKEECRRILPTYGRDYTAGNNQAIL
jgi:hypothetical protein